MQVRGRRRLRAFDKGFVISDHCDWPGLLQTIAEAKPEQVLVTHGFKDTFARYLNENGQKPAYCKLLMELKMNMREITMRKFAYC